MLFTKIIKNILIAQCVCPGVLIGLKFKLNSEDKFLRILPKSKYFDRSSSRLPKVKLTEIMTGYFNRSSIQLPEVELTQLLTVTLYNTSVLWGHLI